MNKLFYGDNLDVLRNSIKDSSIDLVYLDPPFNSNANYNLLFKTKTGMQSESQIEAFEDTWHWNKKAESAFSDVEDCDNTEASSILRSLRSFLGENDMMAYLSMMAVRLLELHRVLKDDGCLYLHCDQTASHYLKILLDAIFGKENFLNEIVWRRYSRPKGSQFKARRYGRSTDSIFFYSKTENYNLNLDRIKSALDAEATAKRYNLNDEKGAYYSGPLLRSESMGARPNLVYEYKGFTPGPSGWRMTKEKLIALDEIGDVFWTNTGVPRRKVRPGEDPGVSIDNLWTDIEALGAHAQERLHYPTQKPVALLERIILASSDQGDVILDPFCGCGTAIHAAQKLERQWIGIDVTHLAISLIERRLGDAFPQIQYFVEGTPKDFDGARDLAARDKYQFQWWATSLVGAVPAGGKKKGMDRGIDGFINFRDAEFKPQVALVSVKGGENVGAAMIRDLKGTMARERAPMGVFISLIEPTREMTREAASAGFYETGGLRYPRIQMITVEQLLAGEKIDRPFGYSEGFKKAPREYEDRQLLLL